MTDILSVRVDKFLWAVRIYKTRSQATDACRRGRVLVDSIPVKPSRTLHGNEILTVRKPPVNYTYKVVRLVANRVSPRLALNNIEDMTPETEKIKLDTSQSGFHGYRKKGSGRPTKKERRTIDKWVDGFEGPEW